MNNDNQPRLYASIDKASNRTTYRTGTGPASADAVRRAREGMRIMAEAMDGTVL